MTVKFTTVLQGIGVWTLLYTTYGLIHFAALWLLPKQSLNRYQRRERAWALITGASAGIGFGCTQELAVRGFNVILLGHKKDELEEAKQQIQAEADVEVMVLVLDVIKATSANIEKTAQHVSELPITILINCVGGVPIAQPTIRNFATLSADEIDDSINMNNRFMAQFTKFMLPILTKNSPSLMLNFSSVGKLGFPGVALYCGTKGFISSFSKALAHEANADSKAIDILSITPGDTRTQCNNEGLTPGSPDGRALAKALLDTAPRAIARNMLELNPYWQHAIQFNLLEMMPRWLFDKAAHGGFRQKRRAYEKALKGE